MFGWCMTGHALRGRDRAGEGVGDRVARFAAGRFIDMRRIDQRAVPLADQAALARDRRIDGRRLAVAAIARIGQAVPRLAVVGIDDMAARAARLAIVDRKSTRLTPVTNAHLV